MIHYKIKPDFKIENNKVEQLLKTLNIYKSPLQRWNGKRLDGRLFTSFEIRMTKKDTEFFLSVPGDNEDIGKKALETTWENSQISKVDDPLASVNPNEMHRIELKQHSMFAIRVDRRENAFMHSLMETIPMMDEKDIVIIQILGIPASIDWYHSSVDAYKKFLKGKMPKKIHTNATELTREGVKLIARGVMGTIDAVVEMTGGKPEKMDLDASDRAMMLKDGGLRSETTNKTKYDAYDTVIRVAIQSKQSDKLARMITTSFREFDGDNTFFSYRLDVDPTWAWVKDRKPGIRISKDFLSTPELSRIVHMPTSPIQEKYNIDRIDQTEVTVPATLKKGGMLFGSHTKKGDVESVYMPVGDWDELCLPRVAIGGMGQGKTKGFGANWLHQAVKNGFGGLVIDPAKGEIGDELQKVLDDDEIIRINIAKDPISLDWCETSYNRLAKNRLANTMISFFNSNSDDAGVQTQRYIRSMVMGMQTTKLSEMIRMMNDMDYLSSCIKKMNDPFHKGTLMELVKYTEGRRMQILAPILNRMDMILGDQFLSECMESDRSLDMVDILKQKKAIVIDVPKKDVGPEGVDIIVNLLTTKIDIAMTLREEEEQTPFFVMFDEPHQYMRSHQTWKSACVESRKWRIGYVWLFHEWAQIDQNLRKIMKSSLPHYHIYPSSKMTYMDLKEELRPYDIDAFLKLKRWSAINVIRSGGSTIKPFICKMSPPPSETMV
ncbi:AAA-like domain protein [Bacillus phage vB_BpsM-61]|nr:AAA-like domain protein [Bacillus phage vB_BpsM-61]